MEKEAPIVRHLIGLAKGYNGFFCPESRFHLMGGMKPQDFYPAGIPLSKAVKVGLRAGTLIDINGTIDPAEYMNGPETMRKVVTLEPANPAAFAQAKAQAEKAEGQPNDEGGAGSDDDPGDNAPQGGNELSLEAERLTEEQIDSSSRKFLLEYIEKHQISKETLGLNSRSDAEEVKNALKIHFGYKTV